MAESSSDKSAGIRLHPQIGPRIVRPTRQTAELVIELAPVDGDPVPALRIPLDDARVRRLLVELAGAMGGMWRPEKHGVEEQKSHVRPCDPVARVARSADVLIAEARASRKKPHHGKGL
ncbi:hypothetical protein AncyloWKF20_05450 [Ancylobacter sp. WKF20]|uniref:hypothetical protein n=1 Tax=Ancylobacter sp. WKF20 TaxID=3039801 RepID=UPI0024346472|nr:hypothetical protein [Ancylobacter sp. WKF20]WGD31270.1 hypothetical protein AncyloWKF20_05450 [Ancylobacter sp. WKF20]